MQTPANGVIDYLVSGMYAVSSVNSVLLGLLLAFEQLPSLSGKPLRDTEREIRALQVMLRHYEEKLVSQIPRMPVAESSSSEPDSQAS